MEEIELKPILSKVTTSQTAELKTTQKESTNDASPTLKSPEKDSLKQGTPSLSSPTSVIISTSIIEEAYRSIDVQTVLAESPKRSKKRPPSQAPTKLLSSASASALDQKASSKKKEEPLAAVEEADILVDAFETMADIATELFNPATYSAIESTIVGAVTNDSSPKREGAQDSIDNVNNKDIPFDERGGSGSFVTPTLSNRKNLSSPSERGSAVSRMRSRNHTYSNQNQNTRQSKKEKDSRSSDKKFHRPKKLEASKSKVHFEYSNDDDESDNSFISESKSSKRRQKGKKSNNSGDNDNEEQGGDWNVLGEFEKTITNVFDALVGPPDANSDDSSSGSSYDSDSCYTDGSESTMESYDASNTDDDAPPRHHHHHHHHHQRRIKYREVVQNHDHNSGSISNVHHPKKDAQQSSQPRNIKSCSGLKGFLEAVTSDGIKVRWHKPVQRPSNGIINVVVYIQISDSDSSDDNVEPNLVWEIDADKKKSETNTTRLKFQDVKSIRQRISLFDIASVQKAADSMNLFPFPHANPENSILITLHDGNIYLFEAKDDVEAKLFIHGLRWISARLVFNLLTGNRTVCSEMLPMSMHNASSCQVLSTEVMRSVTDHLVDKSLNRLSERSVKKPKSTSQDKPEPGLN